MNKVLYITIDEKGRIHISNNKMYTERTLNSINTKQWKFFLIKFNLFKWNFKVFMWNYAIKDWIHLSVE